MRELGASPLKTFSIGFEEASYNELPYAREPPRSSRRSMRNSPSSQGARPDRELIRHLDEPFGDFSIFPRSWSPRCPGRHVKVILSGDGGTRSSAAMSTIRPRRSPPAGRRGGRGAWVPPWSSACLRRPGRRAPGTSCSGSSRASSTGPGTGTCAGMMFLSQKEKARLYSAGFKDRLGKIEEVHRLPPFRGSSKNVRIRPPDGELYLDLKNLPRR